MEMSVSEPNRWILYQRDDCQLCDEAVAILAQANAPDFGSVWIDDNAELEACYGMRVPVLRDVTSERELDWPFDVERVAEFWASCISQCQTLGD